MPLIAGRDVQLNADRQVAKAIRMPIPPRVLRPKQMILSYEALRIHLFSSPFRTRAGCALGDQFALQTAWGAVSKECSASKSVARLTSPGMECFRQDVAFWSVM